MAVRFDAQGESYSRNLGLGAVSAWSVSMWVKLAANRGSSTILWQIDSGTAEWLTVQAWNGTALIIETDGEWNTLLGHTLTVGTWCYIGIGAQTDGTVSKYIQDVGGAPVVSTSNLGATTFNATLLRLGVGGLVTSWLDGSMAAVKVWSGVRLTTDELAQEAWTYLPQRTQNLRAWYPLVRPETTDYSGLAQTLSGGIGTTLEDGPPISWQTGRHRSVIPPSTSITGTLAVTLPALTASVDGDAQVAGDVTSTLPALSASVDGDVLAAGDLAATLPALGAAVDGATDTPGELAATLPPLVAEAQADISPPNILTATLPALTAAVDGTVMHGELAATLPAAVADVSATSTVEGAADATLPALEADLRMDVIYDISPDAGDPVTDWAASTPSRSWGSSGAARGWAAGKPTT